MNIDNCARQSSAPNPFARSKDRWPRTAVRAGLMFRPQVSFLRPRLKARHSFNDTESPQ